MPRPKKTTYNIWLDFHEYLWIEVFVWARGLCEIRISCPASVDPGGATGKIHMRKIRLHQSVARACYHDGFPDGAKHSPPGGRGQIAYDPILLLTVPDPL